MQKRRLIGRCLPLLALFFLLTGCAFFSVDELYAMPQPPQEYYALQSKMKEITDQGGEYIAPLSGKYTQSVLLYDLDGDGVQEAITFFRFNSGETPLKIFIFKQVEDGFEILAQIDGIGTAIDSISFENLNSTPEKELIVSWQRSDKSHALSAYSLKDGHLVELLTTNYTGFKVYDLDSDNQKEIFIVKTGMSDEADRVELYDFQGDTMELISTAQLSKGITGSVETGPVTGILRDKVPAVFVPSTYMEDGYIIDIFICRDGELKNITRDPETGNSDGTVRWYNGVSSTDINGDGIMELPLLAALPESKSSTGTAVNFWSISWRQYDSYGNVYPIYTTYHNERDSWFFIMPDEWQGHIAMERKDLASGGERAVIFSYVKDADSTPEAFLTIYMLSGSNRQVRAATSGRFSLLPDASMEDTYLYVAEFNEDCSWDCGLDEAGVIERFKLIVTKWSASS